MPTMKGNAMFAVQNVGGDDPESKRLFALDREAARRHLDALVGGDSKGATFLFAAYDDTPAKVRKERGEAPLQARPLEGTLDDHADELERLNAEGYGVFTTINQTKPGVSRKTSDVTGVRAHWIDVDGKRGVDVRDVLRRAVDWTPAPCLLVQTSRKGAHVYWRTAPAVQLDKKGFDRRQRKLAALFDGDPNALDISRVLRLAGSWNMKGEPFRTGCKAFPGRACTAAELDLALADVAVPEPSKGEGVDLPIGDPSLRAPSLKDAAAALARIPCADLDYLEWVAVAHAYKAAAGGDVGAFMTFDAWCEAYPGNTMEGNERLWSSIKGSSIGWTWLARRAAYTEHLFADLTAEAVNDPWPEGAGEAPAAAAPPKLDPIGWPLDPAGIPVRRWLIEGRIPAEGVALLFGAPAASKSAFALRDGLAVAAGEHVLGVVDGNPVERLHRRGSVVVYNGEDSEDEMRRRLAGLAREHGIDRAEHDIILWSGVTHGRLILAERRERGGRAVAAPGLDALQQIIRAHKPALVVLDPLVSLSSGLDENAAEDAEFVARLIQRLAHQNDTAVLLIHHQPKNAWGGSGAGDMAAARGSGGLVGAVRAAHSLSVVTPEQCAKDLKIPEGTYVRLDAAKASHSPKPRRPLLYRLASAPVGNGTGWPEPVEGAEEHFNEVSAAERLQREGDTVPVHQVLDLRAMQAQAAAAAADAKRSDAQTCAFIILAALGERHEAPLAEVREAIGTALRDAGLTRGETRQAVDERLRALIGEGVTVATDEGTFRVSLRRRGAHSTAPLCVAKEGIGHG